ncbi:MAG TPA: DUF2231 domain-containing protein, partial [Spirochaetes bacterium]|nr:DUF2231 domain-containing protein [Spirochaetota bacterium]
MQNLHPIFTHYPIALLSFALLFMVLARILKKEALENAAWWCQLAGTLAIIVTVISGLLTETGEGHTHTIGLSNEIMELHEGFQLTAAGIFIALLAGRLYKKGIWLKSRGPFIIYTVLTGIALSVMLYGAHLGGRLVYEFGVGVSEKIKKPEQGHENSEHGHEHGHDKGESSHDK